MKKMITVLGAAMLMLAGCGGSNGAADDGSKVLKVVTVAPYEPYEMVSDTTGELEGFDIDLANALADKLGYTLEWQNLEFDAAFLAVQLGKSDFAIACLSPTPTRKEVMDFSEIYYQDSAETVNTVVCLKEDNLKSIDDLKGLKAGVQNGTIQQETVESIMDEYDLTVDTRKEYADIVQEILNGKIDFMVCEQSMADNYTTAYDELTSFPLGVGEDSAGNAIAFQKGSELKAEFDKEILAMKESGELQDLIDKWFK